MKQNKAPCFSLIIFIVIAIIVCKETLDPTNVDPPVYTSHNYAWEKDTIQLPPAAIQLHIDDIRGTDANNVWMVGHCDDVDYQFYLCNRIQPDAVQNYWEYFLWC